MLFNSLTFFVFAAAFFPVYFALKGRARLWWILLASYLFYGWWDWRFLGLLGFSTMVDYWIGRWLADETDQHKRTRLLIFSLVVNLGLLGTFKYFNFFADSLAHLAQSLGVTLSWPTLHIILPVGISFYIFQTLSYTIDVYRGRCAPERSLLRFACYVALFPQLVAGPIVRASDLLPQLQVDWPFDWHRMRRGLELVTWGFFLKLVVADTIGQVLVQDRSFEEPARYGAVGHLVHTILFSFQIYGDFAGYSLIAIGLGWIMGFDFGVNFRRPYLAASFSEFWQRWHISLSSWLRDYLYIPLGGNRHGVLNTSRNLFVTMFLGGLWHGAAWTFVVWGLLHGFYLAVWHIGEAQMKRFSLLTSATARIWLRPLMVICVFMLTSLAWVFFRSPSLANAWEIVKRICLLAGSIEPLTMDKIGLAKCVLVVAIVLAVDLVAEMRPAPIARANAEYVHAGRIVVLLWMIAFLGTFSGAEFIYFQF